MTDGFVPIGILSVVVDKKIYYYMSVTLSVFLDLDAPMFVLDASIEDSIQFDELVTTGDIPKALGATYDHPRSLHHSYTDTNHFRLSIFKNRLYLVGGAFTPDLEEIFPHLISVLDLGSVYDSILHDN